MKNGIIALPILPVTYVCECGHKKIVFEETKPFWPKFLWKKKPPKCDKCGKRMKKKPSLPEKIIEIFSKKE